MPPDSKETKLGSSNQEASPSEDNNTRIVLVPCHAWKSDPTAISSGVDISKVAGCHFLWQMSSQSRSQKLLQGLVSHELTAYLFLKVVSATFLVVTKALVRLGKMIFISLQKLFSLSRKSDFRILDFQISWHHQMSKHKTRNLFF